MHLDPKSLPFSAAASDVRNSVFAYLGIESRDASNGVDLLRHL